MVMHTIVRRADERRISPSEGGIRGPGPRGDRGRNRAACGLAGGARPAGQWLMCPDDLARVGVAAAPPFGQLGDQHQAATVLVVAFSAAKVRCRPATVK